MDATKALAIFHAVGTHLQLGTQFDVSPATVGDIKRGVTWSSVTGKVHTPKRVSAAFIASCRSAQGSSEKIAAQLCTSVRTVQRYRAVGS